MAKPSSSFRNGFVTPQIGCRAVGVLIVSLAFLLYSSLLLTPGLLRASLKDAVCDSIVKSAVSEVRNRRMQYQEIGPMEPQSDVRNVIAGQQTSQMQKVTILLGVFSMASKVERRNIMRVAYGVQHSDLADVTLRFVIGKPQSEEEKLMVGLESLHYGDILILDCEENMNHGKSFTFFSTIAVRGLHYDYVMKTDDDSYIRLDNLAKSLFSQPRDDLYYGYVLPCENDNPYSWYMAGMGYVISWDLVRWVHDSPIPRNNTDGTEDQLMGDWLNAGNKAKNRVSMKPLFYDHPDYVGNCAHELIPETILIHQVKTRERWHQALTFFERGRFASTPSGASQHS